MRFEPRAQGGKRIKRPAEPALFLRCEAVLGSGLGAKCPGLSGGGHSSLKVARANSRLRFPRFVG